MNTSSPLLILVPLLLTLARSGDGAILADEVYAFPPFERAPGYVPGESVGRHWSEERYRAATEDPRFELRRLRYDSEGLTVVAYAYGPRSAPEVPLPTVVFLRGSYVVGDLAPVLSPLFHALAVRGFAVVAPLLRGSDGGEGADEMGGADLDDVWNVVPVVEELAFADAGELFLLGESRGGMMAFQALRDGFPARAAATWGAFTDLGALLASDARLREVAEGIWPGLAESPEPVLERRSAVRWADALATPLLLLHGGEDASVPATHSLELALALEASERPYELHVYAGDGHLLERSKSDALDRVADWFERHRKE